MGLDMYMYGISKLSENTFDTSKTYSDNELSFYEYIQISEKDIDDPAYIMLKPYCIKCKVESKDVDFEQMYKDYGINTSEDIIDGSIWDNSSYRIFIKNKSMIKGRRTVTIPQDTIKRKYTHYITRNMYVANGDWQVAYWRGEYELQAFIREGLYRYNEIPVDNCGYYKVPDFFVKHIDKFICDLRRTDPSKSYIDRLVGYYPDEIDNEESALFYHEWY